MRCRHAWDDFYVPSPQGRKRKPYKVCRRQEGKVALSFFQFAFLSLLTLELPPLPVLSINWDLLAHPGLPTSAFINYMHLSQFFSSPHIQVKYEKTARYVKFYINSTSSFLIFVHIVWKALGWYLRGETIGECCLQIVSMSFTLVSIAWMTC